MSSRVTTIPASINRFTAAPLSHARIRRVAAYARVSTDSDEQFTSYEAQIDYYTNYIKSRNDWEFVEVYTDEGITGTNTKHREGFRRMVADALEGRFDLIVTKSVSRFARNTVDSLTTVRKLKENGVEIFFEKENIWTFDSKGELLITIMSSLAQEESRSISENCVWGQRKRFADGKVSVPFGQFLGYDRGDDGNLVVNPKEAVIIRRIYGMFLQGMTPYGIATKLTDEGVLSPAKKKKWNKATIRSILSNEKYKGDALLQKSYTVDFLTKKKKWNEGEIPQYYVENNHEAIIDPAVFDMVQREMQTRQPGENRHSGVRVFSGKIRCGECGGLYGSKVWHSNDPYRRVVWQCNHKYSNDKRCSTPHLDEDTLKRLFLEAFNQLICERDEIKANFEEIKAALYSTKELEEKQVTLQSEYEIAAEHVQQWIHENASVALDQVAYEERFTALSARQDAVKVKLDTVCKQIEEKNIRRKNLEQFMADLMKQPSLVTEFDPITWHTMVEEVTVISGSIVQFRFKDGAEIVTGNSKPSAAFPLHF